MSKKVKLLREEEITFKKRSTLSLNEAADLLDISKQAMHRLAIKYDLGRKAGNYFIVDPLRLKKYLEKDSEVLVGKPNEKGSFNCPNGYRYGIDFDQRAKCKECGNELWLRCGEKHDKRERIKIILKNKNKVYSKKELEEKIQEMEGRL